jgi:DNA-binding response OmpR family regulator
MSWEQHRGTPRNRESEMAAMRTVTGTTRQGRILLCDPRPDGRDGIQTVLASSGHAVERCADGEALIESAIATPPALVVYRMRPDAAADLAVLQLLRRVARETPLILLASEGSVATRLSVHSLRPTYFAVAPVDEHELEEAVTAALRRRARAS